MNDSAGTRRGRPLVAEVAGPPGAGKTTLVAALASANADIVAVDRRQRGLRNALAAARGIAAVAPVVVASPAPTRPSAWEIGKMLRLEAASAIVRRSRGAGLSPRLRADVERDGRRRRAVVFDQGPVYTLSRLADLARRSSGVPAFRRWWDASLGDAAAMLDLVVALDASDEALLARIRGRSKDHRAKDAAPAAAAELLARERAAHALVATELAARGLDVVHVDASNPVDTSTAAILNALDAARDRRAGAVPVRDGPARLPRESAGLLVAVVGADGSGKSTLCRDLCERVGGDAVHVYLGSGDGPASPLRRPMVLARERLLGSKTSTRGLVGPGRGQHRRGWMRAARAAWALALAREKRIKLRNAVRLRDGGAVVICDRYPQSQVSGRNDGPLLSSWCTSRWSALRRLAAWEAAPYDAAGRTPPDVVLRLDVDERTAGQRRPGLSTAYLRERAELVRGLRFDGATVVEIDARRPYEEVVASAIAAVRHARAAASPSAGAGERSPAAVSAPGGEA